jgi:hypothetical protein
MATNFSQSPTQSATQAATPTLLDLLLAQRNQGSNASTANNTGASITPAAGANPNGSNITVTAGHPTPFSGMTTPPPQVNPQLAAPITGPLTQQSVPTLPDGSTAPASTPGNGYDNSMAVQQVQQADAKDIPPPGGYGKSAGIYGLLPQGLQHGTLRSVLGSLGDAFLVHGGMQPEYRPRQEALAEGNALAGMDMNDPASVQAAVQRLAATGAPGALDMADKVQGQANQAALQRQMQEQNNWYRQQTVDNRTDMRLQSIVPSLGGVLSGVNSAAGYSAAYDQISRRIQRIDPKSTPEDLGLPPRDGWTPGATSGYGTTGNAEMVSTDKAAQRGVSVENNQATNASRERAATIGANSHIAAAGVSNQRPSQATDMQRIEAEVNAGKQLSPGDAAAWAKYTALPGRGRRAAPGAGGAGGFTATATGPGGQKKGWNGSAWVDIK